MHRILGKSKERWVDVPFAPEYQVSNFGRIKHKAHYDRRGFLVEERVLKGCGENYKHIVLHDEDRQYRCSISRLVLTCFDRPPKGSFEQARHLNDVQSDNKLTNLAWGTPKQNRRDAIVNGKHPYKITSEQVRSIRRIYKAAEKIHLLSKRCGGKSRFRGICRRMAKQYGVSNPHMYGIAKGENRTSLSAWDDAARCTK